MNSIAAAQAFTSHYSFDMSSSFHSSSSSGVEVHKFSKSSESYSYSSVSMIQDKAYGVLESRVAANSIDLQHIYQKIAGSDSFQLNGADQPVEPKSPADRAVDNILGFIENRLATDKANGASEQQLQARLEAGIKGFKQGFAEAQSILKDMGLLDEKLDQDIGQTYERVHQGAAKLEQQYAPSLPAQIIAASYPSSQDDEPDNEAVKLVEINRTQTWESIAQRDYVQVPTGNSGKDDSSSASSASYQGYEFQRQQNFEFELTTQEGDRVTISANSFAQLALASEQAQSGGASYSGVSFQSSSDKEFALAVQGDLNKDELAAINQLLEQVVDLAGDFYSGDIGSAFAKAMELGYDSQQISEFSLDLSQTTQSRAVAAYQELEPVSAWDKPSLGQGFDQLGSFVRDLLDSIDAVKELNQPASLLTDLLSQQLQELEQGGASLDPRPSDFLQQLLGDLEL